MYRTGTVKMQIQLFGWEYQWFSLEMGSLRNIRLVVIFINTCRGVKNQSVGLCLFMGHRGSNTLDGLCVVLIGRISAPHIW